MTAYAYDPAHTHDAPVTKLILARHVREPHEGTDGRIRQSALSISEHLKWSKQELENLHAELHGDGNVREFNRAGMKL